MTLRDRLDEIILAIKIDPTPDEDIDDGFYEFYCSEIAEAFSEAING